jgi:hypothetical protein
MKKTRALIETAVEAMVINHCRENGVPPGRVITFMHAACLHEANALELATLAVTYVNVESLSEFALEELLIIQDVNFSDAGRDDEKILRATEGAIRGIVAGIVMEDVKRGISLN